MTKRIVYKCGLCKSIFFMPKIISFTSPEEKGLIEDATCPYCNCANFNPFTEVETPMTEEEESFNELIDNP